MGNIVFKKDTSSKDVIKLVGTVSGDEWKKAMDMSSKEIAKTIKIDGYRQGSDAHKKIVQSKINKKDVINRAVKNIANKEFVNAINSKEFSEIKYDITEEPPVFELIDANESKVEFGFVWKKLPIVTIGDYKKLNLSFPKVEVTDEELKRSIAYLLEKDAILISKKDNEIKKGDYVVFDFKGIIDGQEMKNGTSKNFELEIGSNQFIPGFEEKMIGLKRGEEKTIDVQFPKDYHAKDIAGKNAKFELKIHDIKVKKMPNLDDEFVKSLNIDNVKNVQELENYQRNILARSKKEQLNENAKKDLFKKLVEITKLSYTDEYSINREIEDIKKQYDQSLSQFGMTFKKFYDTIGDKKEEIEKEIRKIASDNVIVKYAISEISEKENIECKQEDLDEYAKEFAKYSNIPLKQAKEKIMKNVDFFENIIIFNKTIDWLIKLYLK